MSPGRRRNRYGRSPDRERPRDWDRPSVIDSGNGPGRRNGPYGQDRWDNGYDRRDTLDDRYASKRPRSRSPRGDRWRRQGRTPSPPPKSRRPNAPLDRAPAPEPTKNANTKPKVTFHEPEGTGEAEDDADIDYDAVFEEQDEDLDKILEERRRKRAEILAKYENSSTTKALAESDATGTTKVIFTDSKEEESDFQGQIKGIPLKGEDGPSMGAKTLERHATEASSVKDSAGHSSSVRDSDAQDTSPQRTETTENCTVPPPTLLSSTSEMESKEAPTNAVTPGYIDSDKFTTRPLNSNDRDTCPLVFNDGRSSAVETKKETLQGTEIEQKTDLPVQRSAVSTDGQSTVQSNSNETFELEKGLASSGPKDKEEEIEQMDAGDYNPNDDRRLDFKHGGGEPSSDEESSEDDILGSDDDMFAIGLDTDKPKKTKKKKSTTNQVSVVIDRTNEAQGLVDNFDDPEGYYKVIPGEVLDGGRYHVQAILGKGMFSSVVRAKDTTAPSGEEAEVAIKIIRSQESMYKAGQKEINLLQKLQREGADEARRLRHIIRLLGTFDHRGHLCMVFEALDINLREVVKKYGKNIGISLPAVRVYASQIMLGLSYLHKCNIVHADLKPDNILVNSTKSLLKICDLGSAADVIEGDITPYLVSRFYRAPEIILGMPYDCGIDVWSIACTLYELYTGKILFPGRTNNHMLLLMMQLKGKVPHRMIRKGSFGSQHFDELNNFIVQQRSSLKGTKFSNATDSVLNIPPNTGVYDLKARLAPSDVLQSLKGNPAARTSLLNFVDLLDKMLTFDPARRPTAKDLLSHPFLSS